LRGRVCKCGELMKARPSGGVEGTCCRLEKGGKPANDKPEKKEKPLHSPPLSGLGRRNRGSRSRLSAAWQSGQWVRLPGMPVNSPNPQLRQPGCA
jgi:hypothetical protein